MGLFGFGSSNETLVLEKSTENKTEEILGLEAVKPIVGLEVTYDGKFLTPSNAKSTYSEKDWKTLRTEAFLQSHPEWKQIVDAKREWWDLATTETIMLSRYGTDVEGRNRFLDVLRTRAVENHGLTKAMIEEVSASVGYSYPKLTDEIYSRYEQEIKNRNITPTESSDAYTKYTALERRSRDYIGKIVYATDVANTLREQKKYEDMQHTKNHYLNVEIGDTQEKEHASFLEKETALKNRIRESIKEIPLLDRMQWRPGFAGELRALRKEYSDTVEDRERGDESIREDMNRQFTEKKADISRDALSAAQKLGEYQNSVDSVKDIPVPTKQESGQVKQEIVDAVSDAINALILEYKVVGYDEVGTKKRALEIEQKIATLLKSTPYLNASGEPNRETLQEFIS